MSQKEKDIITLVAPNGAKLEEKFKPKETVAKTLEKAIKDFAKDGHLDPNGTYELVLDATKLESSLTLEEADVTAGSKLKVRAKEIPGDGNASRL